MKIITTCPRSLNRGDGRPWHKIADAECVDDDAVLATFPDRRRFYFRTGEYLELTPGLTEEKEDFILRCLTLIETTDLEAILTFIGVVPDPSHSNQLRQLLSRLK